MKSINIMHQYSVYIFQRSLHLISNWFAFPTCFFYGDSIKNWQAHFRNFSWQLLYRYSIWSPRHFLPCTETSVIKSIGHFGSLRFYSSFLLGFITAENKEKVKCNLVSCRCYLLNARWPGDGEEVMVLLGLIPTSHVTSVSDYVASSLGRSLGWALINFMLSSSLQ